MPSRIEDAVTDARSGEVRDYLVAAPFLGTDGRWIDSDLCLRWATPRGVGLLPVRVVSVEVDSGGLKQWRVRVTGPAKRDQRRHFARVSVHTPVELTVLPAQELEDTPEVDASASSSPEREVIGAVASDVSEGGLAVTSRGAPLVEDHPVRCRFVVGGTTFTLIARVVRSVVEPARGGPQVHTALRFVESGRATDDLRKRLFQLQSENRRRELDAAPVARR